jgi:hypothetical protein
VSGDKGPDEGVFACFCEVFVEAFCCKGAGGEFGPVDLFETVLAKRWEEEELREEQETVRLDYREL